MYRFLLRYLGSNRNPTIVAVVSYMVFGSAGTYLSIIMDIDKISHVVINRRYLRSFHTFLDLSVNRELVVLTIS